MPDFHGAAPLAAGGMPQFPENLPEPVFANGELLQRWRKLRRQQKSNFDAQQALAREGNLLDRQALFMQYVQSAITVLCGDPATAESQGRKLAIEELFEAQVAQLIDAVKQQATQARLAAGTQLTPEQMAGLAQQAGIVQGKR
jgi:hypothetical protein